MLSLQGNLLLPAPYSHSFPPPSPTASKPQILGKTPAVCGWTKHYPETLIETFCLMSWMALDHCWYSPSFCPLAIHQRLSHPSGLPMCLSAPLACGKLNASMKRGKALRSWQRQALRLGSTLFRVTGEETQLLTYKLSFLENPGSPHLPD